MQRVRCALFVVMALSCVGALLAAEPARSTTLTVPGIDCPNCAKKVATALEKVPGVASVTTDRKADTAVVIPQANAQLSPRMLWETVEKIGKKPTKIVCPSGTFTDKPAV